jgi:hypothetical protein
VLTVASSSVARPGGFRLPSDGKRAYGIAQPDAAFLWLLDSLVVSNHARRSTPTVAAQLVHLALTDRQSYRKHPPRVEK